MLITNKKQFPQNYSSDVVDVLNAMSFTGGKKIVLVGSASLRSQQYTGDYDGFEEIEMNESNDQIALQILSKSFQDIIKTLRGIPNCFIGDIKAGEVEDYRIFPIEAGVYEGQIKGYNSVSLKGKVQQLADMKIITPKQKNDFFKLLVDSPSVEEFFLARDSIRPEVVRWTSGEVLQGYVHLPDRQFTLEEAFGSPGLCKLDVISWVQGNHFSEFSLIYKFFNNGKALNPYNKDIRQSLKEDIILYQIEKEPFKSLKRRFALAKLEGDTKILEDLLPILNGDLGRIYSLQSDIKTILFLLERNEGDMNKLHFELDQFKERMSKIWNIKDFLYVEPSLLGKIDLAIRHPPTKKGALQMKKQLEDILSVLGKILEEHTPKYFGGVSFHPERYYEGLSYKKKLQRKKEIEKASKLSYKDPKAYKVFKTDKGVETKPSEWTLKWNERFPEAKSLEERSKATGVPLQFIEQSFNRGRAAFTSGHRPGASPEAWGFARASSFLLGGPTSKTTDSDLRREAEASSKKAKKWFSNLD